jgi:hypothetical protein
MSHKEVTRPEAPNRRQAQALELPRFHFLCPQPVAVDRHPASSAPGEIFIFPRRNNSLMADVLPNLYFVCPKTKRQTHIS